MSVVRRRIIAIIMALVLLAVFLPIFAFGYFLGVMATDSCANIPNAAFLWIQIVWPIMLVMTAFIGPILIIKQIPWRWVWLSLGISLGISVCWYLGWFPLLSLLC